MSILSSFRSSSKRSLSTFALVLIATLVGPARLPSAGVKASHFISAVQINDSTIQRGQNGTVTVDLTAVGGADPENTIGFSFFFDPTQLAFISAVPGSGAAGASLTINQSLLASGYIGFALAKSPGTGFPAGTNQILVITMLSLANGTALSTGTSFADVPIARELVSVNVQSLPASWMNGIATLVNGCVYTISPAIRRFSAKVGSGTVAVTTGPACPWQVSNFAPFVTITSPTSGVGNGTVNFDVAANGGAARSGQAYVAGNLFTISQGTNFLDVDPNDIFYEFIGRISAARVTLGCNAEGTMFCPESPVTRGQMAAFIIRALGDFSPPTPTSQRFNDVPPNDIFYAFIDEMGVRGITLGCLANPPLYCPFSNVTREQMAAFMIRALGNPNPVIPATQRFNDVNSLNIFYAFIDDMAVRNITLGCSVNPPLYCPSLTVTRGQMAAFLSRAFGL